MFKNIFTITTIHIYSGINQSTIQQTRSIKHWQTIPQCARRMLPTHKQPTVTEYPQQ